MSFTKVSVAGIGTTGTITLTNVSVAGVITATDATFSGNVSVGGTLTYEDVTNVDSVGLVTARSGILVTGGGGINLSGGAGVVTATTYRVGTATTLDASGLSVSAGVVTTTTLRIAAGSAAAPSITPTGDSDTGIFFPSADTIAFGEGGSEAARIDSSGRLGIGVTSPSQALHTVGNGLFTGTVDIGNETSGRKTLTLNSSDNGAAVLFRADAATRARIEVPDGETALAFGVEIGATPTERMRIDSSGRLLVGTSSYSGNARAVFQGHSSGASQPGLIWIRRDETLSGAVSGADLGIISFGDSSGGEFAQIIAEVDGGVGSSDYPGRLVFSTTADGASSPTERMRISSNGNIGIGNQVSNIGNYGNTGVGLGPAGFVVIECNLGCGLFVNRTGNDGDLVQFAQDATFEGSISVSGSTVSYNGAHLSRWSQLPSGMERTEILRGSVLSNIDEMCEWGDEENEQLNRMKVSDVEGDKNVSGVFQAWDDDDDTYTNDFYCAMTGDFIIRIAEGVTVERGDLLMSAGDGTAKPQDDDIIRSKTIAKVTSTNVSCTYEDGSYCVPCVLMAC